MKTCNRCGIEKPLEEFYPSAIKGKSYRCRQCNDEYGRQWIAENLSKRRTSGTMAARRRRSAINADPVSRNKFREYHRERLLNSKRQAFKSLGNKCWCCGETQFAFLQVDHVNNDGAEHRRQLGHNHISKIYRQIVDGTVSGLQLLCANCNWGKRVNGGTCPHVEARLQSVRQEREAS